MTFLLGLLGACPAVGQEKPDPLLDLLIKKGMITEEEAHRVKSEAEAIQTNAMAVIPPTESKWKISKAIKNVELFGDVRLRFEDREADSPTGGKVDLQRARFAVRLGLRGDAFDNFYYGVRLETAANPRSPWVTLGTSSSGIPYYGPAGKSANTVYFGQVYLGWHPTSWLDISAGKMPNVLYATPMVWDTDINPEGAFERFKYTVGQADFFATFGQFLYQDTNPEDATGGLGFNGVLGQQHDLPFQLAWQGGVNYHFTTNIYAKAAATLYHYIGAHTNVSPFFGDTFVGEGTFTGAGTANPVNGASGYGTSGSTFGYPSFGFPNNQVGLNHLLVIDVPVEVNFQFGWLHARVFGDYAYNLEGKQRAEDAAAGYAAYLTAQGTSSTVTVKPFAPQTKDVNAYQVGFGLGNGGDVYGPMQGLVYGSTSRKRTWEFRTYFQHVEQYALDPNTLDSDFFEGRGNLEGIYAAVAYSLTDNVIGTFRYGYAWRINDKLGTGGSNLDIPQVNPIDKYNLLQADLTFRF